MNPETRAALHDFTLEARKLLLGEVSEQLEGVYGLLPTGAFEAVSSYPALSSLAYAHETRSRLEKHIADEQAAGLKAADAREKLARETAFTWLNRLVAFRMMEARKIIRQSVERGADSRSFKFWLTEPGNEAELARYEAGTAPQDDLGEGPRDTAYRHFLLYLCRKTSEEIRVLFDADNLASRLFPRPLAFTELLRRMNAPELIEAWSDDQTIGWVYQYFNELEKAEVFARLNKGGKIQTADIPAATQIFTPRWVVKALVENSLGRLWIEMHPDSRLRDRMHYFVPASRESRASLRPVREITLLDPATGTMHFGLVAFDLLVEMYREEIARAGERGWPEKPSVEREEDIPAAIIANNIFGIDIDLRAVQLSALTLLLKAKSMNKDAVINDHNLACADVLLLNGERLGEFLEEARFTRPIYERLIRGLWERLKNANQMGSLLRLERDLAGLIAEEKEKVKAPRLPGFASEQFESEAGRHEFWEIIQEQIAQAFDHFARQRADEGSDESYFTGEATKGMQVLRLTMRRYDVVATNPPYLHRRNMSSVMSDHLKKNYPASKGDLYAAFIDRCADLLAPAGRIAMITQQSFMFISSYEALRKKLRERVAIETMIHVGPRAFAEVGGEKVNTIVFVFRREDDDDDGIVTLDEGHSDDLAARVLAALQIILGNAEAAALVRHALGNADGATASIRRYLERDFFKQHIKQYRKRPVYWLFESPAKSFGIYVFHERQTRDTLFRIQRQYIDPKINLLETRMAELHKTRDAAEGRERRQLEKPLAEMAQSLDDARKFSHRIKAAIDRGYEPHIDDGVLLNMAPLWELIPSWQAEPKKAWLALERGDYDWAHTAMDYWPERVRQKCAINKSFAIAHGITQ